MDEAERVFREDAERWRQRYEELRQKCGSVDLTEHQRVVAALEVRTALRLRGPQQSYLLNAETGRRQWAATPERRCECGGCRICN